MPKPRARRVPALAPARLRAFIDRLKLAKLAGREPKRAASLCPTVLLKIAGHGAPDKPAAVIPAIDRNEPPRIKVDSALGKRWHRRRRAFRRQQCQLLRIVKQTQARAAPAEPSVDQGDGQALRELRERLQARAVPIIDGAAAYEVLRQVASVRFLPHSKISQLIEFELPGARRTLARDRWIAVQSKEYVLIRVEGTACGQHSSRPCRASFGFDREHDRLTITATQMRDGILKPRERSIPCQEIPAGPERPDPGKSGAGDCFLCIHELPRQWRATQRLEERPKPASDRRIPFCPSRADTPQPRRPHAV